MSNVEPTREEPSDVARLRSIVDACERFEADWRRGYTPRVDAYLDRIESSQRERTIRELLAVEIELRVERGEKVAEEDLRARYPDWSEAVDSAFARRPRRSEVAQNTANWSPSAPSRFE